MRGCTSPHCITLRVGLLFSDTVLRSRTLHFTEHSGLVDLSFGPVSCRIKLKPAHLLSNEKISRMLFSDFNDVMPSGSSTD
jgi:hypothetical protein